MMTQRREAIAAMIATRKELEGEIQSLQGRISSSEQQVVPVPAQERSDDLLQLASQDNVATENPLDDAKARHVAVCKMISSEELTLRRLLSDVNEHRRDLKLMAASA